ncbi:protease pro-enzyme activation domain-containing protein [Streptomyces sp. NPDC001732]
MRTSRARSRTALSIAATLPLLAGALVLGAPDAGAASAPGGRDALQGTRPARATAGADRGAASDSGEVRLRVHLAGRDAKGLAAYAAAVSDPRSASYGKYPSAGRAQARFGATPQQIDRVARWLGSNGLTVTGTNRHYVSATGEVAAAEKAFGTRLRNYRKGDRTYRAPSATASVPAALGHAVLAVSGLDDAPHRAGHDEVLPPPDAVFRNSGPFSTYYGSRTATTLPDGSLGYDEYRIGGTSLAAPVVAGVQALAQQARHGLPIGFANPAIYARYGSKVYHDVTDHPLGPNRDLAVARVDFANGVDAADGLLTSVRSLGKDASLKAVGGYDDVTGVGTPAAGYVGSYRWYHRRR